MNPSSPTTAEKKIRVLLVDDHAVVRQGLRMFIEMQQDMEVVGEGTNGIEAIELEGQYQPDVILMDLIMPQMGGVEATSKIREKDSHARVLILTSFGEDDKVFPAIRAGAQGYLLKDIQPADLIRAIRDCCQDKAQLAPDVARRLMNAVVEEIPEKKGRPAAQAPELQGLTEREKEVLGFIARGFNNHEIAEKMVISEKTVKTHVSNILDKLDLEDRTRAAIWALKQGLGDGG